MLDPDRVETRPPELHLHPSNIFDVEGLVAVVTGGGTGTSVDPTFIQCLFHRVNPVNRLYTLGIGLMMATALEHNGATVYIVGRRKEVLEKAAREHSVRTAPIISPHLSHTTPLTLIYLIVRIHLQDST